MKHEFIGKLRCPACKNNTFLGENFQKNETEIITGSLICSSCKQSYEINEGIIDFLYKPDHYIKSEIIGWHNLALYENWISPSDEYILQLPRPNNHIPTELLHWDTHADNFELSCKNINLKDKAILDIGAGRCWSSNIFAQQKAIVTALDIVIEKGIGLKTAEVYFKHCITFFERVLGDMNNLPFNENTFDIVFFTGALHHSNNVNKTLEECSRVLKKNGQLIMTNEACGGYFSFEKVFLSKEQSGINEHNYRYSRYLKALHGAGLCNIETIQDISFITKTGGGKHWILNNLFGRMFSRNFFYKIKMYLFGGVLILKAKK
jgi:ubiquinone/menaquinone biosynthesis C-methylase UbiE/uncharacterized protein YbaR (Trm112 family)